MNVCGSCGAPIRWVRTVNDGTMPLDPEPCDDGNVTLDDEQAATPRATVWAPGGFVMAPGLRYKTHFATCPFAKQHRRRR